MTIIVFLVDTSASMNVRCYLGGRPTLLDVAKSAIETFIKTRQRSPESRGDRYMLLSFEEHPHNIKAGWKENLVTFMDELKNLRSDGLTTMGRALKNTFDLLNINRMQSGIDTYGQGWCPYFLDPTMIVVITDGGKLTTTSGIYEDFNLPMHALIPGSELTREPFRWDQRLFSLVLRLSGTPMVEQNVGLVPSDSSPIDAMCEVTGGRSYCVTSHRILNQCIDSLVQKVQSGVVINFEKIGPDPLPAEMKGDLDVHSDKDNERISVQEIGAACPGNQTSASSFLSTPAWHNCRKLIYVPRTAQKGFAGSYWPIPEDFWPDLNNSSLPPRLAQPNVKFTCTSQEPMVIENLPFDKYELEPSPLTQYILAQKQPNVCWQAFVANSYKNSGVGHPFGYLKASTNLTCVNLFVLPYNYPVLLPLLDELFKLHRLKPTIEWRTQFQSYLHTLPPYYASPLKRALIRMGSSVSLVQTLIPDAFEYSLSVSVINYLKALKSQAKSEYDKICNEVGNRAAAKNKSPQVKPGPSVRVVPRLPLRKELVTHPLLKDKLFCAREQINEYDGFCVRIPQEVRSVQSYLNPGDIPRSQLFDQFNHLREKFFRPNSYHGSGENNQHDLPINQMGNYQEYLKRMPLPLREVESAPVRRHMFGNPFKIDKRMMMVDEADVEIVTGGSITSRGTKRAATVEPTPRQSGKKKPGPLPKDLVVRRPYTPAVVPPLLENSETNVFTTNLSLCAGLYKKAPKLPAERNQNNEVIGNVTNIKTEIIEEEIPDVDSSSEESYMSSSELAINNSELISRSVSEQTNVTGNSLNVGLNVLSSKIEGEQTAPFGLKIEGIEKSWDIGVETGDGNVDREESLGSIFSVDRENNTTINHEAQESAVDIKNYNMKIRARASVELRKPGKRYEPLFEQLKLLKGNKDTRLVVVEDIISEVLRFKRFLLAKLLRDFVSTSEFLAVKT